MSPEETVAAARGQLDRERCSAIANVMLSMLHLGGGGAFEASAAAAMLAGACVSCLRPELRGPWMAQLADIARRTAEAAAARAADEAAEKKLARDGTAEMAAVIASLARGGAT